MGVFTKYDEILDDTVLRGVVDDDPFLEGSDGDWNLWVKPAPGWEGLLRNPDGYINSNGMVQCEVEPPDKLPGGKDAESGDKVVEEFMGPIKGRRVRVVGTWTRDRQHTFDGSTVFVDIVAGDKGKTEIHPITSLLGKLAPPNPRTRRFVFLVFSDDSFGAPPSATSQPGFDVIIPPHADENRRGEFRLAIPSGSNISKVDEHKSKAGSDLVVTTAARRSFTYVSGSVASGKASEGKGFYHLVFDVPALFSLRAYFDSEACRATAPLLPMPPECKAIQDKLNEVTKQFTEIVAKQVKDKLLPMDHPMAEKLREEKTQLLKQLHACLDNRRSLRDILPAVPHPCAGVSLKLQQLKQGKKFDKKLKQYVDRPVSPEEIAAQEQELAECVKNNPPSIIKLKTLIESAYP